MLADGVHQLCELFLAKVLPRLHGAGGDGRKRHADHPVGGRNFSGSRQGRECWGRCGGSGSEHWRGGPAAGRPADEGTESLAESVF